MLVARAFHVKREDQAVSQSDQMKGIAIADNGQRGLLGEEPERDIRFNARVRQFRVVHLDRLAMNLICPPAIVPR